MSQLNKKPEKPVRLYPGMIIMTGVDNDITHLRMLPRVAPCYVRQCTGCGARKRKLDGSCAYCGGQT